MRYKSRLGEVTPFEMPGVRTPNVPAIDVQNTDVAMLAQPQSSFDTPEPEPYEPRSHSSKSLLLAAGLGVLWFLSKKRRR